MKTLTFKISFWLLIICTLITSSCEKLIDVGSPKESITSDQVFETDASAVTALNGLYSTFAGFGQPTITAAGLTIYNGMSADELRYTGAPSEFQQIDQANILSNNFRTADLWVDGYKIIYVANSLIEGAGKSTKITANLKAQLIAEAKTMRSFVFFNMIQVFGDVPLILTTDYRANSVMARTSKSQIISQITNDLKESQNVLSNEVIAGRPNRYSIQAILAKIYLLQQDWASLIQVCNSIIGSNKFQIQGDLNSVFLANSKEAIWQITPVSPYNTTIEGTLLIPANTSVIPRFVLTTNQIQSFEFGDKRLANWTKNQVVNSQPYVYPYKYKVRPATNPKVEFNTVMRLAEVYLMRAEAYSQSNNLIDAISDLDIIRSRAGIPLIKSTNPNISKENLLLAIAKERRNELFCEWGLRWFDIKRRNEGESILKPLKPGWDNNDLLYPIPLAEVTANKALVQNPGY